MAGDKLHFAIPLPRDEEALEDLLRPSKELVKEALLERQRKRQQGESADTEGVQERLQGVQEMQPRPRGEPYVATAT